jgi:hypothetical protein
MAVPDLEPFALRGQQLMGQPVRAVVISHPGDAAARIGVYGWNQEDSMRQRLSATSGMVMFSAATGEVLQVRLPGGVDGGGASLAQSVLGGLHRVEFGGWRSSGCTFCVAWRAAPWWPPAPCCSWSSAVPSTWASLAAPPPACMG